MQSLASLQPQPDSLRLDGARLPWPHTCPPTALTRALTLVFHDCRHTCPLPLSFPIALTPAFHHHLSPHTCPYPPLPLQMLAGFDKGLLRDLLKLGNHKSLQKHS